MLESELKSGLICLFTLLNQGYLNDSHSPVFYILPAKKFPKLRANVNFTKRCGT
jgi:hypothetical protein